MAGLRSALFWVKSIPAMTFEFDPAKSSANRAKHGIDFNEAQALWQDPDALVVPARRSGEPRRLLIAEREGRVWTAIYTERGERTRLISVRRARENEKAAYYEH